MNNSGDLGHNVQDEVNLKMLETTKQLSLEQRKNQKKTLVDRFFEKTSNLGAAVDEIPIFLVKEFSLARINAYFLICFFSLSGFWAALRIKNNLSNGFMMIFPALTIIFSIYKIISCLINLGAIFEATKKVKVDVKNNYKTIPIFIVRTYRSLITKNLDVHWASIIFYIIGGLFVLIPAWLNGKTIPYTIITFRFDNLDNPWGIYSIVRYALIGVAIFQVLYTIWVRNRLNTIDNFYGSKIVSFQDELEIKKTRHAQWRRGVLYFIMVVGFIFVIIHFLIKRLISLKNRK